MIPSLVPAIGTCLPIKCSDLASEQRKSFSRGGCSGVELIRGTARYEKAALGVGLGQRDCWEISKTGILLFVASKIGEVSYIDQNQEESVFI